MAETAPLCFTTRRLAHEPHSRLQAACPPDTQGANLENTRPWRTGSHELESGVALVLGRLDDAEVGTQ